MQRIHWLYLNRKNTVNFFAQCLCETSETKLGPKTENANQTFWSRVCPQEWWSIGSPKSYNHLSKKSFSSETHRHRDSATFSTVLLNEDTKNSKISNLYLYLSSKEVNLHSLLLPVQLYLNINFSIARSDKSKHIPMIPQSEVNLTYIIKDADPLECTIWGLCVLDIVCKALRYWI